MTGFIIWIGERWREWERLFGRKPIKGQKEHDDFDTWLTGNFSYADEPRTASVENTPL